MLGQTVLAVIDTIRNALDYPLRQLFRWRRGGFVIHPESKEHLFVELGKSDRMALKSEDEKLRLKYHLEAFHQTSTVKEYCISMYYLGLMEKALNELSGRLPDAIRAVDIGSSDWIYVQAQHAVLTWWQYPEGRQLSLEGYEADAYRIYRDFHSRYDHALAHIRDLKGVSYVPRKFTRQEACYDVVTMCFPFVFMKDHLEWGLPTWLFTPQQLLEDAWRSVKPGGVLIIINQGDKEHQAQKEMLRALNVAWLSAFRYESKYYKYSHSHHVLVVCR